MTEFLIAIAAVAVFLCPLACLFFFKKGIEYGRAVKENKPLEPVVKKAKPLTEEELKAREQFSAWFGWNGDKEVADEETE